VSHRSDIGRWAELAVSDYLTVCGFDLLARNLRVRDSRGGWFEVDVVARDGPLVVAVEVRTRGPRSYESALASIGPVKQRRLRRAVSHLWRDHLAALPGVRRVRIDAAAVTFEAGVTRVEYIEGAM
jgi:putative endonuclease